MGIVVTATCRVTLVGRSRHTPDAATLAATLGGASLLLADAPIDMLLKGIGFGVVSDEASELQIGAAIDARCT